MSEYPPKHHPVFFLESALNALGAQAEFARDERTEGCWGLIVNGKPMVWLIDNRWPHEREKEDPAAERLLKRGALVCHAQKPDMERVGGHWLPLAVTPGYELPTSPPVKVHDVAFIGYVRDAVRSSTLIDIASRHSLFVGENCFGKTAVTAYHEARVGVNIPTNYYDPNCWDINMRVMEIAATGTPLITNYLDTLAEIGFTHGVNCLTYTDPSQIVGLIDTLVNDPALAYRIGWGGASVVFSGYRHLYVKRAEQVLQWLQS